MRPMVRALLQRRPLALSIGRRWSYAGFYVDEAFTRLALQLWPGRWIEQPLRNPASRALPPAPLATNVPQ